MIDLLIKSPPKPEPSTIRRQAMSSTMMQPLGKGALALWAEGDAGALVIR